jgi:hypothetical protein
MSEVPWEFRDLVTTEGLKKRPQVQQTPFDDVRFWLSSPSAESVGLCEQLQRDALLETIAPSTQLCRLVPSAPEPVFTAPRASAVLSKLWRQIEREQKNAPRHQQRIAAMLSDFKTALGGRGSTEAWSRLEKSCLDCLHAQILAGAS